MGSHFLPRLVNGPFDDPALFVPFRHENRALLFDLGDIAPLSARDILKITHIFVTHTHMDHFVGFDRVLRLLLGRDKDLYLFGPQGFLKNLSGKLAGYCWNLVGNYHSRLTLHATELHPDRAYHIRYPCRNGFLAEGGIEESSFDGRVLNEPALTIRAVHLCHGTPVLAFALHERFHVHIIKAALERMQLTQGRWLSRFKDLLYDGADPQTLIEVPMSVNHGRTQTLSIGALRQAITRITPGQRIAYVTDAAGTSENMQKIVGLAHGADHLFVEAAFSHLDRQIARQKHHLTACQAGALARSCRARRYSLFHFSPRYSDCPERLAHEAKRAFEGRTCPG